MPETSQVLTATIERALGDGSPIDLETGEFPIILATQGETSDGHILNIAGASAPDSIPLQIDHVNSARANIGSISRIRVSRRGSLPVLRAMARIELSGDGEQAAIRRDVAHMIAQGHLRSVSVRARGTKAIPRTDLPVSHPAHVSSGEKDFSKRFGMFIERSEVLEGSIIALGSDKRAIIGRSLDEPVSDFWAEFLDDQDPETETETEEVERDAPDFSQVEDVRTLERILRDVGASRSDAKRIIALCKSEPHTVDEPARETPGAEEPRDAEGPSLGDFARDAQSVIRTEFQTLRTEILRECSDILSDALGRVKSK